jgi:acyl-coenzyme A thioesterase PaaI-like protein
MKLSDIRFIIEQLRERSPALVEEFKTVLQNPRELGVFLESKSPWLSRKFLGAASNIAEPFLAGTGLSVERLEDELVEVRLPGWWRNQGEAGTIHSAAIVALGELASRLYWEHHLDLRQSEITVRRVEVRVMGRIKGDVRGIYRMPTKDREAIMHQLRADNSAHVDAEVSIFDQQERMAAQVEIEWILERHLSLAPGRGPEGEL